MSRSLREVDLLDLVPVSIRHDPAVQAATRALQQEYLAVQDELARVLIRPRLDELDEPLLSLLAWEEHLDGHEGWLLAAGEEEQRALIAQAAEIHRTKGTLFAVRRVFELLGMRAFIERWFEYGGEPGTFRVEVLEIGNQGLDQGMYELLEKLVDEYKAARSHMTGLKIFLTGKAQLCLAGAMLGGEAITVYPWSTREVQSTGVLRLGTGYQCVETVTIYPLS
ncbi:phage tail protein I [Desulfocurvibacter africanus]|uniref:phage tail protein I n=1 Tax=Desulfocurvibacter africanus TaxID=873 RepID=UPI0003FF2B75|nr:phage tail protein I [Desulfocurvibacter africanus]